MHATAFLKLVRKDCLTRFPFALELGTLLLAGFVSGFGLTVARPRNAAIGAFAGILVVVLVSWVLFLYSFVWFAWLIVVAQILSAFA